MKRPGENGDDDDDYDDDDNDEDDDDDDDYILNPALIHFGVLSFLLSLIWT